MRHSAPGRVWAGLSDHMSATTSRPSISTRRTSRATTWGSSVSRPRCTMARAVICAASDRWAGSEPPGIFSASSGESIAGRRGLRYSLIKLFPPLLAMGAPVKFARRHQFHCDVGPANAARFIMAAIDPVSDGLIGKRLLKLFGREVAARHHASGFDADV